MMIDTWKQKLPEPTWSANLEIVENFTYHTIETEKLY